GGAIWNEGNQARPKISRVLGRALILKLEDTIADRRPGCRYFRRPSFVLPSRVGNASRQRQSECDYDKKPRLATSLKHSSPLSANSRIEWAYSLTAGHRWVKWRLAD